MIDPQIAFLLILAVTFVLLVTEWIRLDLTAILAVVTLVATGVLSPAEAFSGFSSEPALTVAGVFVLSAGLYHTGMTDNLGAWVATLAGKGLFRTTLVIMVCVAVMSSVTHHLMITAMMLPIVLSLAQRNGISASKLLIPMSLAASIGTTLTLIGAPALLIAGHLLERDTGSGLGMFSLTPIGIAIVGTATLFMCTIGRVLLPAREGAAQTGENFRLDRYFTEVVIEAGSPYVGKPLASFRKAYAERFEVVDWLRHGESRPMPFEDLPLAENDVLLVRTSPDLLASITDEPGLALHAVAQYGKDLPTDHKVDVHGDERLVQVLLAPGSALIGRTMAEVDFRTRYGVVVVGLWRKTGWFRTELSQVRLKAADVLVVWGDQAAFSRLQGDQDFLMMVPFHGRQTRRHKATLALGILAASVLAAATEVLPVQVAFVAGAAAMALSGCVTPRQAYSSVEAKVFVFIAGAIPLGLAMEKTGVSAVMAGHLATIAAGWSLIYVLAFVFVIAALLTQILSDAATVVLLGPVAMGMAKALNVPPEPLVVCTAIGAVAAFLTPIGHHGNLLVYGPGNYRFSDFVVVGVPLTVIIGVICCSVSMLIWA